MTADASWRLQQALHQALSADAALGALVAGVFDHVPHNQAPPFLTLGEDAVSDFSTKDSQGARHALTVHAYSRAGAAEENAGQGRKTAKAILAAAEAALGGATLALAGHALVDFRVVASEVVREKDGETYHGLLRCRAVTQKL